jgi:hypothetical protein
MVKKHCGELAIIVLLRGAEYTRLPAERISGKNIPVLLAVSSMFKDFRNARILG